MTDELIAGDSTAQPETVEDELVRALEPESVPTGEETGDGEIKSEEAAGTTAETTEETNADALEYLTQFTEMIENTDESTLYGLKVKSGRHPDKAYTISEMQDHMDRREAFDEERTKFETEKQEAIAKIEELKTQAGASVGAQQQYPEEISDAIAAEKAIAMAYQAIDWNALEKDDPGTFAAQQLKYQTAYAQAQVKTVEAKQKHQAESQDNFKKFQAAQFAKTVERIPEWKDQKAFEADHNEIYAMVADYGYTPQEVNSVLDPRLRHLLRDYSKLKQTVASANADAKKVTERGNVVLRSNFRPKRQTRTQQTIEAAKRPNATKKDRFAAERELLGSVPGFLD